jgi:glycosyltransferase involved in cell wall biosynthesis
MILFLTPPCVKINGGVMSIYSLCETSRKLNPNSFCIISTYPNDKYTYAKNDKFLNDENIYRFEQIVDNCKNLDELIMHIPDGYSRHFYKDLKKKDICFLKSIKNLHINILNQNIELMPKPNKLKSLRKLTSNITQTIAHDRYATQEVCDKWQIPTHLFSVKIDTTKYQRYDFEQKEKTVVLSPDDNENKEKIVNKLKEDFPDWNFKTVQNLTFSNYMDLISRSYFTITFGEGMDGYFLQPEEIGSIGFAVYNDEFFPDKSWADMLNVFSSYDDMYENISKVMKKLLEDKDLYKKTSKYTYSKIRELYNFDTFEDNLKRFYEQKYDYTPKRRIR